MSELMFQSAAAPLCPAGHLPHKGGDRLVASGCAQLISPPVGEMSGRTEGGNPTLPTDREAA